MKIVLAKKIFAAARKLEKFLGDNTKKNLSMKLHRNAHLVHPPLLKWTLILHDIIIKINVINHEHAIITTLPTPQIMTMKKIDHDHHTRLSLQSSCKSRR